ncbi:MAG: diguanylate cyclase [Gammaproteobacteria bacterium]
MSTTPEIHVLVIDDDIEIYELIAALLSQSKLARYSLEYQPDVDRVEERLRSGDADVCLVDHNLEQHLTGLDLIGKFGNSLLPFVLVTSEDRPELDYEALRAGAAGFVYKKDLSTSVLDRTIRYALAHAGQIRTLRDETANHRKLSMTDVLTGMPNRREFDSRLNRAILSSTEAGTEFGMLYIDLNGFKRVNDSYGHDAGDRVLQILASRLLHEFRSDDSICRVGGDEFVAIIFNKGRELTIRNLLSVVASRLLDRITKPVMVNSVAIEIGASFGSAVFPHDGADAAELIKTADNKMFLEKRSTA